MYRIGSLFSGIGGLELGLERSGLGETVWYSEINKISSAVYATHWDIPNLGDITEINWTNVPPVDVVCGGFPCQPFSQLGKGEGVNDKRWLWSFIHDCVEALQPRWVVLENVADLLRKHHRTTAFDPMCDDLRSMGYSIAYGIYRASDVGAPHPRKRLLIVATQLAHMVPEDESLQLDIPTEWMNPHRYLLRTPLAQDKARYRWRESYWSVYQRLLGSSEWITPYLPAIHHWEQLMDEPIPPFVRSDGKANIEVIRWMMGFPPDWIPQPYAPKRNLQYGNAVVPQLAERLGEYILHHELNPGGFGLHWREI